MRIVVDLFCGAGGATKGYQRAGFFVIGVDLSPQPNYCGDAFVQMDALEFMARMAHDWSVDVPGYGRLWLADVAAWHGSPPCQTHSALTKGNRGRGWYDDHEDFIVYTRSFFDWFGVPYVIENVQGAPVRRDLTLCGLMFGLRVFRHRYFELGGWSMPAPPHPSHKGHRVAGWRHGVRYAGDMVAVYGDGGGKGSVAEWQEAMGIDWTSVKLELAEAIPPAFSEFVGAGLVEWLAVEEEPAA